MSEENVDPIAKKKAAQAKAHAKWRASEKGKAYYQRLKLRKAGVVEVKDGEVAVK